MKKIKKPLEKLNKTPKSPDFKQPARPNQMAAPKAGPVKAAGKKLARR